MILSLLFLTPLFNYIPDASLAAVIISAVYDLIDFTLLPKLWRVNSTYGPDIFSVQAANKAIVDADFVPGRPTHSGYLVFIGEQNLVGIDAVG